MGLPHDGKLDEFVLKSDDAVIEFLDVSLEETHEHLCQAVCARPFFTLTF